MRRRRVVDYGAIKRRRGTLIPDRGELIGLDHERHQVAGLERERPIDRGERGAMVALVSAGFGEAKVCRRVCLAVGNRPLEELTRLHLPVHCTRRTLTTPFRPSIARL